ncbi:MAG TPA: serine hydrolase, partial [Actinomycetota bacterium]|nr:serine hydrolase [Actinomycetota bacterium]
MGLRIVHRDSGLAGLGRDAPGGISALGRGRPPSNGAGSESTTLGNPTRLTVRAPTAILVDLKSGRVLFAKNSDQRRPIASLAKIMTAVLVLEHSNLSDVVVVTRKAAHTPPIRLGLHAHQRITVGTLLWGLLLWSGNDASVALAEHVSGSVGAFRMLMNQRARALGLGDTYFASPR